MAKRNIYDDGSNARDRRIRRDGKITVLAIILVLGFMIFVIMKARKEPALAQKIIHFAPFLKTFFSDGNAADVLTNAIQLLYI